MPNDESLEQLQRFNQAALIGHDTSQTLPAITLADGTKLQTGTVGTLIKNIKLYDRLCAGEDVEGIDHAPSTHIINIS